MDQTSLSESVSKSGQELHREKKSRAKTAGCSHTGRRVAMSPKDREPEIQRWSNATERAWFSFPLGSGHMWL